MRQNVKSNKSIKYKKNDEKKRNVVCCRTHVAPMQKMRGCDKFIAAGVGFSDVAGVAPQ
jgi:hypothetical protein